MVASNQVISEMTAVTQKSWGKRAMHQAGYLLFGTLGGEWATDLPTPDERAATLLNAYREGLGEKNVRLGDGAAEEFGSDIADRDVAGQSTYLKTIKWGMYIGPPLAAGWAAAPFVPFLSGGLGATALTRFASMAVTRGTPPVMRYLFGGTTTKAAMAAGAAKTTAAAGAGALATKGVVAAKEALTSDEKKAKRATEFVESRKLPSQKETPKKTE